MSTRDTQMATASGAAAERSVRRVRHCTIDTRLVQIEDEVVNRDILADYFKRKMTEMQDQCYKLMTHIDAVKSQLESQQLLTRKYRSIARRLETNQELLEAKDDLKK